MKTIIVNDTSPPPVEIPITYRAFFADLNPDNAPKESFVTFLQTKKEFALGEDQIANTVKFCCEKMYNAWVGIRSIYGSYKSAVDNGANPVVMGVDFFVNDDSNDERSCRFVFRIRARDSDKDADTFFRTVFGCLMCKIQAHYGLQVAEKINAETKEALNDLAQAGATLHSPESADSKKCKGKNIFLPADYDKDDDALYDAMVANVVHRAYQVESHYGCSFADALKVIKRVDAVFTRRLEHSQKSVCAVLPSEVD